MPTYLIVRRARGPAWNPAVPMRSQPRWAEHAAFMNGLAAEGFIVLGGPLGTGKLLAGEEVLLIINATREAAVRARFDADPWTKSGQLIITRVEPWTVLLRADRVSD
jgi:uncharacterized protein YciI